MTWNAQLSGAENLPPEMEAAFAAGVQTGLEALGVKGAEMVEQNIATPYGNLPPAVAFGHLVASIVSSFTREATMCREVIGVAPTLGADVYAAPVETGARPHMPPPSALIPWVQKKFGFGDEKQVMSIAFAVAKTIAKRGMQGHFMFERALDQLEPIAPEVLEAAIAQALAEHGFTGGHA
ncbi:MAG TPA: hypothetical protein VHX37_13515 [Acidobacteriaceae bacterium]|jgi:hypothetical protein|nr:hypothetical protein [Acidobacteriaceae bacterium]